MFLSPDFKPLKFQKIQDIFISGYIQVFLEQISTENINKTSLNL